MGCGASNSSAARAGATGSSATMSLVRDDKVHPTVENSTCQALVCAKDVADDSALPLDAKDDTISTAASTRSGSPAICHSKASHTWPEKMFLDAPDHSFMIFGVYAFLPWSQRGDAMCLTSEMRRLQREDVHGEYWRWHCECLCAQSLLFLPSLAPGVTATGKDIVGGGLMDYRALFGELWPFRFRFLDDSRANAGEASLERFRVSVFCRMRPAPPPALCGDICEELLSNPVTLPLGQRVALVRQRHPELTRAQAMRALLNSKCGAADPLEEEHDDIDDELKMGSDAKRGEAMLRPQTGLANSSVTSDMALSCGSGFNASVLSTTPGTSGSVLTVSQGIGIRKWSFLGVFGESSSQQEIYETCGHRLSTNLMNGQNGSLIAYGQTGSGKTHTMFGPPQGGSGLVPSIIDDVLKAVEVRRSDGFKVKVGISVVEVFGNDVSNLLGKTGVAKLCARMGTKYVLEGRFEKDVEDSKSFRSLLSLAEERKRKAHTEMNERSTRAHTIVMLRLRQQAPGQETMVESVLSLVDLGGSERVSKSKANENACCPGAVKVGDEETARVTWKEYYKSRERITETNNINKGLLALKRCVQALNERQQRALEGRPLVRVPYTDSKLTVLLQPALSGQAHTSIVVCCSEEDRHAEETVQSLRFGEMCSCVEHTHAETNGSDVGTAVTEAVSQIDAEIKEVEKAILAKEKWEWVKSIRQDVIDELDTGGVVCNTEEVMELGGAGSVEIKADDGTSKKRTVDHEVWSQVLVGAEAENARRDELIKTRARLLGAD